MLDFSGHLRPDIVLLNKTLRLGRSLMCQLMIVIKNLMPHDHWDDRVVTGLAVSLKASVNKKALSSR